MQGFANNGTLRADFQETRRFSLLTEPIETEGVLYFEPPWGQNRQYYAHWSNGRFVIRRQPFRIAPKNG